MERIAIVGPGAMGMLFSYYLQPVCPGLVLVDHLEDRAKMLAEKGVRIDLKGEVKTVRVKVTAVPEQVGPVDLMLLCVKAYSTGPAVKRSRALIGKDTLVLTLQNGLGNVEEIMESVAKAQVLGGTTSMGANVIEEGFVRFAGSGETVIGQLTRETGQAKLVAELFQTAGLEAKTTDNLEATIWSKVLINVGINALTALLRVRNGKLVEHEASLRLVAAAVKEAESVAKAKGIKLLYPDALKKVEEVAKKTSENISSMFQDVRAKQQTEIEAINGAIVKEAARLGLPAPVNGALRDLVRAVEESYGERL